MICRKVYLHEVLMFLIPFRKSDINILVIVPLILPFYLIESYLGLPSWIPCRTFGSMIFRTSRLVGYVVSSLACRRICVSRKLVAVAPNGALFFPGWKALGYYRIVSSWLGSYWWVGYLRSEWNHGQKSRIRMWEDNFLKVRIWVVKPAEIRRI